MACAEVSERAAAPPGPACLGKLIGQLRLYPQLQLCSGANPRCKEALATFPLSLPAAPRPGTRTHARPAALSPHAAGVGLRGPGAAHRRGQRCGGPAGGGQAGAPALLLLHLGARGLCGRHPLARRPRHQQVRRQRRRLRLRLRLQPPAAASQPFRHAPHPHALTPAAPHMRPLACRPAGSGGRDAWSALAGRPARPRPRAAWTSAASSCGAPSRRSSTRSPAAPSRRVTGSM
jgi:hypothetical protein